MDNSILFTALREFTSGLLNQLLVNLSGQDGEAWQVEFKKFLRKEECWAKPVLEVWKTIKLGTHKDADDLQKSLEDNGNSISGRARYAMGKPAFAGSIAKSETEIDLCVATVKDLTGKDIATTKEVFDAIQRIGGELCPAEVGPQLRLQYGDQPNNEYLRIAMESITDSDGDQYVFDVVRGVGDCWLYTLFGHSGSQWRGGLLWVFVLRK